MHGLSSFGGSSASLQQPNYLLLPDCRPAPWPGPRSPDGRGLGLVGDSNPSPATTAVANSMLQ
jgi:hypothetical protein